MGNIFADRISDVPRSFIREILKTTINKNVISFAGGLPNRDLFPLEELKNVTNEVFNTRGKDVLQYGPSEGISELRKIISDRYKLYRNLEIEPDDIIITTGSQQGLDLIGKTILNEKDDVIIEEPGYLGAIQAFSVYKSRFHPVCLEKDGINLDQLKNTLNKYRAKIFYMVPNFQNPSGISYTREKRTEVANMMKGSSTILIEDDPYGELRFSGENHVNLKKLLPEQTILLGSFSKMIVPGLRVGWLIAPEHIREKILIAKQASDLHTDTLGQYIISYFMQTYPVDKHIEKIIKAYSLQRDAMIDAISKYLPPEIDFTRPEGGMFLWLSLPGKMSALKLFEKAIKEDVAFVPGDPFYINKKHVNTMRLNFSCADEKTIKEGIKRLSRII